VNKSLFARWQANFWAGLVAVLPAVITLAIVRWVFFTFSNLTATLLIFLPAKLTHRNNGEGEMYWHWNLVALVLAVALISFVGMLARYYFGRKMLEWMDSALMRIPLLNKIYGTTKQVNEAFSASNKSAFRTVVLVEFPHAGAYSIGFITNEQPPELKPSSGPRLVCVFVPATPNPTSGFLLMVPEDKVSKLDMSVAEGIKYVISLGAILPGYIPAPGADARHLPLATPGSPQP
jgi:uncharacterized membrane protein